MIVRLFLAFLLAATPSVACANWHKANSDHFVVYGDTDEPQLRNFVERLEKFDAVLRVVTGQKSGASPVKLTVFVVRDVATLQKLKGPGSKDVYGYYSPQITGPYAVIPRYSGSGEYDLDAETVLYHEYAHHFMLQYFPAGYPAWYVEGFAEYFSTMVFRRDGNVAVGMPAKHRFGSLIYESAFPLERMLAADVGKMKDSEASSFYAYAWLLTHYLRFEPTRKGQLQTYLNGFAAGKPPMEAATTAFGDIKRLENDLNRYMKARRLSYTLLAGMKLPTPQIAIDRLGVSSNEIMPLYLRFMTPHDAAEIARFAVDARAAAAKYPTEPGTLEMLAEGELDAEQFSAATKANDALLAIRPTDGRAILRRARIAAAQMQKSKNFPGGWKAIRSLIVKANRASPDDPFPLLEYFNSFGRESIPVPDIAGVGLRRALELAPQAVDLRFTLAGYLIEVNRKEEARIALAPLVNHPHSAEVRNAARAMLGVAVPGVTEGLDTTGKSK